MFRARHSTTAFLLGGLAAAITAPSAHAVAQAETSLSGIGYQLNALDSLTVPQVTFSAVGTTTGDVSAETYVDHGLTLQSSAVDSLVLDGLSATLSLQAAQPFSQSSVVIGSGAVSGTVDLTAAGSASGGTTDAYLSNFYAVGGAPVGASFTLSPKTSITFFASVSMLASTSIGLQSSTGNQEWSLASVSFYVDGTGETGSGYQINEFYKDLYAGYTVDAGTGNAQGEILSFSDVVSVTFSNVSNAAIKGSFYAVATANGESAVSSVPEPATAALALVGLIGLIPMVARTNKRHRATAAARHSSTGIAA